MTISSSTSQDICEVYWIHTSEHKDIFSEGYIGISVKGANRRFIEHKAAAKAGSALTVHNAIRKHGDNIIVETIIVGTSEYCLDIEAKLRPFPHIGWNISPGGALTRLGMKLSDESRKKISLNNSQRGRVYNDEEREAKRKKALELDFKHTDEVIESLRTKALTRISQDGGKQLKAAIQAASVKNKTLHPWQRPNTDTTTWLIAGEIYESIVSNPDFGQRRVAKLVGTTSSKISCIFKKIKIGWIPHKDPEWVNFKLKGK